MDRFKPPRSSPPTSRLARILKESSDAPSSVESLATELQELTPDEIDLIDAIIQRAGPAASTFLTIFKAYSEVLAEHGLADANETVCYGKLLKLGTLKGRSWAEKWEQVKRQHRPNLAPPPRNQTSYAQSSNLSDIFDSTIHFVESTPRQQTQNLKSIRNVAPSSASAHVRLRPKVNMAMATSSVATSEKSFASTAKASTRPTRQPIRQSKIDEQEAWKRIQMERDQENAILFHEDKLVERFWGIWRQGHEWIATTSQQVSDARDHLLLERHLERWHAKYNHLHKLKSQADAFAVLSFFKRWVAKLQEAKHRKYRQHVRQQMRQSMKLIRERYQSRILQEAWIRWRRSVQLSALADSYKQLTVRRYYTAWKTKWLNIRASISRADVMLNETQHRILLGYWEQWKTTTQLRALEATMRNRVELRILDNTMTRWRAHSHDFVIARQFDDRRLEITALGQWKSSMQRVESMEHRADRHLAQNNMVYMYALMKVWKDKRNGHHLERKRLYRIAISAMDTWGKRMVQHQADYALADRFSQRPGNAVVKTSLQRWKLAYQDVGSILKMADAVHNGRLASQYLLLWRKSLRNNLKMIKMARAANKWFLLRHAYVRWRERAETKNRERLLTQFLMQLQAKKFKLWLMKTRVRLDRAAAAQTMSQRVNTRIMHGALSLWIQRTVEIKEREFQISQQCTMVLLLSNYDKWKKLYKRRVEVKSLLENYLLVREEELRHRVFNRWLAMARHARSRRRLLLESETEIRLQTLEKFWDIWREKRLKDPEDEFLLRWNGSVVRNHFKRWYAKTKAPPAIQFHAIRLKRHNFDLWRVALSRAAQAKEARNFDQARIHEHFFSHWLEAYRAKKMRKAIARARHLRLPAAPKVSTSSASAKIFPRRNSFLSEPPPKEVERHRSTSPIPPQSVISSTYVGGRLSAVISAKSASPRTSFAGLRDRSPFRTGDNSALSRTKSEDGSVAPNRGRKAPSSIASLDVGSSRSRAWPDLTRKPRLFFPPNT
ncbi:hypothetical protein FA15DRAFT_185394 [Coprinopsis marcescibilis]|uniref:Sfi1 spindle body domain-containing protein n=1 Tax=Coprinopsis marcescibilis TaxID=230819 RepID=A0A5C3LAJ1_COPMA|nr:hypothetical protein FA15DRAFT_185394 [Coprinopsis marcescibilis]